MAILLISLSGVVKYECVVGIMESVHGVEGPLSGDTGKVYTDGGDGYDCKVWYSVIRLCYLQCRIPEETPLK